jgi:hypothetical protein
MNENFAKLIEQAERARSAKIAKFLELLNDPDIRPYLAMLQNGNGPSAPEENSDAPKRTWPPGFKTGNGIQETIKALALPPKFTGEDVYFALKSQGFPFAAKDERGSIRDALFKLTRPGKFLFFRIIKKGAGGEPSIYERIPQ